MKEAYRMQQKTKEWLGLSGFILMVLGIVVGVSLANRPHTLYVQISADHQQEGFLCKNIKTKELLFLRMSSQLFKKGDTLKIRAKGTGEKSGVDYEGKYYGDIPTLKVFNAEIARVEKEEKQE
jgi:hypothetical protein